jgi:hypothetical protein
VARISGSVVEGRVTAGVPIKAQQAASVRLANCQMTSHGGTESGRDNPNRLVSTRRLWFGLSGALEVVCVGRRLGALLLWLALGGLWEGFCGSLAGNDGRAVSGRRRIDLIPSGNARDGPEQMMVGCRAETRSGEAAEKLQDLPQTRARGTSVKSGHCRPLTSQEAFFS